MKVLVLGGGVIGAASAYFLNEAGHEVTIIDRNKGVGLETSFANGGIVSAFTARPWASPDVPRMLVKWFGRQDAPYLFRLRPDWDQWKWALRFLRECTRERFEKNASNSLRLSTYSYDCLKNVREKEQIIYDQGLDGVMHLYATEKQLAIGAETECAHSDSQFHPQVLDIKRCIELEPALAHCANNYAGALFFSQDESGDAHKFTSGIAVAAQNQGVNIKCGISVRGLEHEGGSITGVYTDDGLYTADVYLMSLGSYSPLILKTIGMSVPIYPLKGYSVTIPIENTDAAPKIAIHEGSRRIVMSRLGDRLRSAGSAELAGYNKEVTAPRAKAILDVTMNMFPECGDATKAEHWVGLRPMTPDCLPILGPTKYKNLYMNTGHGSTGWTYACGSGKLISDMISGVSPDLDLSCFAIDRF